MQRTFLSNLTVLLILNLLIKPAYLLLVETEVQNRVGAEVYGKYAALLSLSFLLNIILDLGLNTFTSRAIARNKKLAASYLGTISLMRILLGVPYFILLFATAWLLHYEAEAMRMLGWIGLNQLLAMSILYLRSNLSGMLHFRQDAILSVLDRGLLLIGLGGLLFWSAADSAFDIFWFIYAQTAAYSAGFVVALIMVRRKAGRLNLRWRPSFKRIILKQSLPYALLVMLMMIYYKTDSVMLERMLPDGAYHAGIYAMSYRLFEATNMLGYLFATLLLPIFTRLLKDRAQLTLISDNAYRLILTGGSLLAAICLIWPVEILSLVYDRHTVEASPSLQVLMLSFFFIMITYLWGTLLTAKGSMKQMNRIALSAVALNIILNYLLIPVYTAFGSALASLLTQILVAILQWLLVIRILGVKIPTKTHVRSLVYLLLLGTCGYLCTIIDAEWWLMLVVLIAIALLSAFGLRLLKADDAARLLRERKNEVNR